MALAIGRTASRFGLPLVIRSIGPQRTFQIVVSTILSSEKQIPLQGINNAGSGFTPLFLIGFSTAAVEEPSVDENLIRALESGIDAGRTPEVEGVPEGFPFDIQDSPGNTTVTLDRRFEGEIVKMTINTNEIVDIGEANTPSCIPLLVTITKPNGQQLKFCITAFPREFTITELSFGDEGYLDLSCLDSILQKAFHKYVEARGLEPSTLNFMFQYLANKGKRDWFHCLNKVKKFVEY